MQNLAGLRSAVERSDERTVVAEVIRIARQLKLDAAPEIALRVLSNLRVVLRSVRLDQPISRILSELEEDAKDPRIWRSEEADYSATLSQLRRAIAKRQFKDAITLLDRIFAATISAVKSPSLEALRNFLLDCESLLNRLILEHPRMSLYFVSLLQESSKEVIRNGDQA